MADMRVGKGDKQQERPVSRTTCCGVGAHALICSVYIVTKPDALKPTQSAEQIGGFRGCSKCFKPLGYVTFKPGQDVPQAIWVARVARGEKDGLTAYYAQRNADGSISLYDWSKNPTVKHLNRARSLQNGVCEPPRPESIEQKKKRALEQARIFNTTPAPKQEDKRANAYEPEAPEFPEAGDAQEPGNSAGDNPDQRLEPFPFS